MATISDEQRADWFGIGISGKGLRAEVELGVTGASRSANGSVDQTSAVLSANDGLEVELTATVGQLELTGRGGRGGVAEGVLVVDLGRPEPGKRRVVLVEEDGQFAWFIPAGDGGVVELPIEERPGSRGRLKDAIRRVVRVIAVKTVGRVVTHVSQTLVGGWDKRKHPYGLRAWGPEDHGSEDAPSPDWDRLKSGPALLVIHGFMGSIHSSFTFDDELVREVNKAYGDRTFAFNHPTLIDPPDKNAKWLLDQIPKDKKLEVDILAHSRGGLVARELAQKLNSPHLKVRSILFVASPNGGTPLADIDRPQGLLHGLTNLVGAIPGAAPFEMAMELLQDVVIGSALDALHGLIAMDPKKKYLRELNALPLNDLVLRAMAADFEPRTDAGIALTARDKLIDLYFGGVRNDLIVPTVSPFLTDGTFHIPQGSRLVLDSSRGINHTTFWKNDRATKQFLEWLRPDTKERPPQEIGVEESDPRAEISVPPDPKTFGDFIEVIAGLPEAARKVAEEFVGGPISKHAKPLSADRTRRAVVVVPGIMGSHLRSRRGDLIWIDPMRLSRGQFSRLILGTDTAEDIQPAGLNRTYIPLIAKLAESSDVYMADFDWRADIRESARLLAKLVREQVIADRPERVVHFVAHSMGGLVCRALSIDGIDPGLWKDLGDPRRKGENGERSGRLVMLGTPNAGSYSIPLTLIGAELILKGLAAIDFRASALDLAGVVATFPGVYQMLPAPFAAPEDDQHEDLYDAATWGQGSPVRQALLDDARDFHEKLKEAYDKNGDQSRFVFVAGYGHATPFRLDVKARGAFSIGRIANGDGRVAVKLGMLDKDRTYFVPATHGGLPSHESVLNALEDLLSKGRSSTLLAEEPARRGVADDTRPPMLEAEQWDPLPAVARSRGGGPAVLTWRDADVVLQDALSLTLGGGTVPTARPRLRVKVVHAGLEQGKHPIVVGHYSGLPPGGAELALDSQLRGTLRRRQRLGMYPEKSGSAIYVPAPKGRRPVGGLVLGLGDFGGVTEAILTQAMTQAVLDLVLDTDASRAADEPLPKGVSSVLVGVPGRYGLPLQGSIRALVTGVARAVIAVRESDPPVQLEEFELELIEYYENRAENAAQWVADLAELLEPGLLQEIEVQPGDRLERRGGARPGSPQAGESGEPWVRVEIGLSKTTEAESPIRTVDFTMLTRGSQANIIEHEVDLEKVREFVDEAVMLAGSGEGVSRTLFELLFPLRSKLDLDPSESLHLLVDEEMAQLPWELLASRDLRGEVTELALRAGMLRQLRSGDLTRERSERPMSLSALVVGDPPTDLPRLPGARDEAIRVRDTLRLSRWSVTDLIYSGDASVDGRHWIDIDNALHAQPYRLVHIAGHGIFEEGDDHVSSGVVIGPGDRHRITALDFRQMTVTPDLVFLNCCHLGRLGDFLEKEQQQNRSRRDLRQPHRVAGTVARQLLLNGVRAVIVAGWEVDDAAGLAFATTLYQSLLDGHSLGDAVRVARTDAREADGGRTTTWGAYQCYGDPGFTLVADRPSGSTRPRVVSSAQLARGLEVLKASASDSNEDSDLAWVAGRVEDLRADGADLADDAVVLSRLGDAYGELGDYERAITAYQQALNNPVGSAPFATAEQLANFQVRLAVRLKRGSGSEASQGRIDELLSSSQHLLNRVIDLAGPTGERLALLGSFHKKRATLRPETEKTEILGDLDAARVAYGEAWQLSSRDKPKLNAYHTNLWLQMAALTQDGQTLDDPYIAHLKYLLKQLEEQTSAPENYWDLAAHADTLITCVAVGHRENATQKELLAAAQTEYLSAFGLRSTVRERESSTDHLDDLIRLVKEPLAKPLRKLLEALAQHR